MSRTEKSHRTPEPIANGIRDRLAIDRTVMANERTYLAWLRSGLALLATGLGVMKFMFGVIPVPTLVIVASFLMLSAAIVFLIAAWRYTHIRLRMYELDVDATPPWQAWGISLFLVVCTLMSLGGFLWLAPWR